MPTIRAGHGKGRGPILVTQLFLENHGPDQVSCCILGENVEVDDGDEEGAELQDGGGHRPDHKPGVHQNDQLTENDNFSKCSARRRKTHTRAVLEMFRNDFAVCDC